MKKILLLILFCLPIFSFGQCTPPDGCESGKGTYTYSKDQRYEGGWLNGEYHGTGTLYYNSVQRYEGEWLKGKRHGTGTHTYSKEQRYEGEWLKGERHGTGTYYYDSVERYEGEFLTDEKHGDGAEYYNDGRIWTGNWIAGEKAEGHFNNENYYDPTHIKGGQISSAINLKEIGKDHYYMSIDFNGLKKDFVFDTGATSLAMSSDLLLELKKHGVKVRDLKIDAGFATVASGQKVSTKDYVIDNIRIGDYLLNNVVVSVGAKGTSSLCGIRLFNKFSNVHWNMQEEQLILYR